MGPRGIGAALFVGNVPAGAAIGSAQGHFSRDDKKKKERASDERRSTSGSSLTTRLGESLSLRKVGGSDDRLEFECSNPRDFQSIWPLHNQFSTIETDSPPRGSAGLLSPDPSVNGEPEAIFFHPGLSFSIVFDL